MKGVYAISLGMFTGGFLSSLTLQIYARRVSKFSVEGSMVFVHVSLISAMVSLVGLSILIWVALLTLP